MHIRSKDQEIYISTKVVLTMPLKSAKNRAKNVQNFREEKNEGKKSVPEGVGTLFWCWGLI